MKSDNKYLLALSQIEGLGPISLKKMLESFSSIEACFKASFLDFKELGFNQEFAYKISEQIKKLNPDEICHELIKEDINIITIFDDDYSELLKEIYALPYVIYYRGEKKLLTQTSLAVVGSRKISHYAQTVLPDILTEAIQQEIIIVSGLAYGVDSLAHRLALKNKSQTIAVVGSGLAWDYIYPQGNRQLAQNILNQNGLILSEFPPSAPALPANFPRRNRIISGISKATLIVEASIKSGALITAKFALDQGREVMAIPGPVNSTNSQGTNYLIQNGAKVIVSSKDILESFGRVSLPEKITVDLDASTEETVIIKMLKNSPVHIDKIIENCTLETSLVNSLLTQMELKGWLKDLGGQNYISLVKL